MKSFGAVQQFLSYGSFAIIQPFRDLLYHHSVPILTVFPSKNKTVSRNSRFGDKTVTVRRTN